MRFGPLDSTRRPQSPSSPDQRADILLVDDEPSLLRALERVLRRRGYTVVACGDGQSAARAALSGSFGVVVSDINMPGLSGTELLEMLRSYDRDVPVILMTGQPTFETARSAIELGAMKYLSKPIDTAELFKAIDRALCVARTRVDPDLDPALAGAFDRALGSLWMAFQPIVSLQHRGPVAYEALVRSHEPAFKGPGPLLDYAERSGRLTELGRVIRELCADAVAIAPRDASLFVNLHTQELNDPELFSSRSLLASYSDRIVLEITERGALDEIDDVAERTRRLRALGYRVAVDDLGAGYAGLSSIAVLEPDFVKLDMSLTRDLAASPLKQRLVASMIGACRDTAMSVVAEGVETVRELSALRALGCDLLQGYHFARPSPEFVSVTV